MLIPPPSFPLDFFFFMYMELVQKIFEWVYFPEIVARWGKSSLRKTDLDMIEQW